MWHRSSQSMDAVEERMRPQGFTLIELMMVVAIIGILAVLGVASYRIYVLKAEAVQHLVDYGHIRTVVAIRTYVDEEKDLQRDSVPGAAPPALRGSLDDRAFNGKDGVKFQFIRAPAGVFASFPHTETYALAATANNPAGVLRLRVLRLVLPHGDGDKVWVQGSADASAAQLVYPIQVGPGDVPGAVAPPSPPPITPPTPPAPPTTSPTTPPAPPTTSPTTPPTPPPNPPGSGSSNITGEGTDNGGTWTANVRICVGAAAGGPLTGQNNTSVRYRVVTPYANFQEDLKIDPATGCVEQSYGGLPAGGNFHVEVIGVVDYNPPNSGGTSILWDGVKPTLDLSGP